MGHDRPLIKNQKLAKSQMLQILNLSLFNLENVLLTGPKLQAKIQVALKFPSRDDKNTPFI